MRSLLQFIYRYNAFFLFLLLEIFCFVLIYRHNRYQQTEFINSTNKISATIYDRYNSLIDYLHLRSMNDSLHAENARLHELFPNSQFSNYVEKDTIDHVRSDSTIEVFQYIPAEVISISVNRPNNYITINRGSNHGIIDSIDMGVISSNGIVGIVKDVSANFATIIPLINRDFQLGAKLKIQGNRGYVIWTGTNASTAQLMDIPNSVQIRTGDEVITSGTSLVFPEGIPVGKVKEYKLKPGSTFFEIDIELATDFRKLDQVYVVRSIMKTELDSLENLLIAP